MVFFFLSLAEEQDESEGSEDDLQICEPGKHQWEKQVCMICKSCSYCTGYGPGCCNQGIPNRAPGRSALYVFGGSSEKFTIEVFISGV